MDNRNIDGWRTIHSTYTVRKLLGDDTVGRLIFGPGHAYPSQIENDNIHNHNIP
ncbi:MAG: hypothetical protein HZA95_01790 [Candidatus Vogelbacteria bacterium]|nr:hypothetical protein [Candidatus Vogelbacteria bacterium]